MSACDNFLGETENFMENNLDKQKIPQKTLDSHLFEENKTSLK